MRKSPIIPERLRLAFRPRRVEVLFKLALLALLLVATGVILMVYKTPELPKKRAEAINPAMPPVSAALKPRVPQPQTLPELLALSTEQLENVDLATMNLLCASGLRGAENLDVEQALATLDQWAKHVAKETLRNFRRFAQKPTEYGGSLASYRMAMLVTVLQEDFQAHYNLERAEPQLRGVRELSDTFFGDSRDVFLHGLLGEKRTGTCASLPVLYAAVAQRLGYPVTLAATKEHLYVRYDDGEEHLNVEATGAGFDTFPDEHYRKWPAPISKEEERAYGWLRSLNKRETLGDFLTTRALTLTSMKRFDEAVEAWTQAAARLPETSALKRVVQHAHDRATNEKLADRWDALWTEVERLPVPSKPGFTKVRDKQLRLQRLMNQSTDLAMIERAVTGLKEELNEAVKQAALVADSGRLPLPTPATSSALDTRAMELLAVIADSQPICVRIPAERVPVEYGQGLPPELQARLRGMRREEEIVTEIHAFHVEELNRRQQAALAALPTAPAPLPRNVSGEWLPAEYREALPIDLRNRLVGSSGKSSVERMVRQYQTEQALRQQGEAMRQRMQLQMPLTAPPVQIEIVPSATQKP